MAEMIRVRIGAEPKYFAATEDKRSVAFVRVAEARSKLMDGQWVEQDSAWYDAVFEGGWADRIAADYQVGDALVLMADKELRVRETPEGSFKSTRLCVKGFGPDPLLSTIAIDRSPKQGAEQSPWDLVTQARSDVAGVQPQRAAAPAM